MTPSASFLLTGALAMMQFAVMLIFLCLQVRQRRYGLMILSLGGAALAYLVFQYAANMGYLLAGQRVSPPSPRLQAFIGRIRALPQAVRMCVPALLIIAELLLLAEHLRYEGRTITPQSVKEATDLLPSGICFWLPGGLILMKNPAAEDFCRQTIGQALLNGQVFADTLFAGTLAEGCRREQVSGSTLILLPDGSVWALSQWDVLWDGRTASMLQIDDITPVWQRTEELRRINERLLELNDDLLRVNRGIVDITARQETLAARVKIHDDLGSSLLAIRRFLAEGGSDETLADIRERLSRSLLFLHDRPAEPAANDYELLEKTAADLGVTIETNGSLPPDMPQRSILTTALHECLTNTIRHAGGTVLRMHIRENADGWQAVFTNNGRQPEGPLSETGGLASLRTLTENAGGTMTVETRPVLAITITLPKEVPHAHPRSDRG